MFATRRALLWTFAGGCLSGALFILSAVGGVSLWRDFETSRPERTLERRVAATPAKVSERRASEDDAATLAVEPPRAPAAPRANDEHASGDVASQKDAQDSDGTNEAGASVADVLVRLEKAYRQRLAPTTPAVASSNVAPEPTATASGSPAPASTIANAAPAPTTTAAAPTELPAREPSVTVSVIVQNPPAPAPPAEPPAAAPVETPPAVIAQNDAAPSGLAAAPPAAPTTVNIENLHQGDVYNYNVQQQLVQQYMQVLGASPYGSPYGGYPVAAPRGSRHYAYYGPQRFSNLPALPLGAPPFPSYIGSVTNPDNPNGVHSRALRFR